MVEKLQGEMMIIAFFSFLLFMLNYLPSVTFLDDINPLMPALKWLTTHKESFETIHFFVFIYVLVYLFSLVGAFMVSHVRLVMIQFYLMPFRDTEAPLGYDIKRMLSGNQIAAYLCGRKFILKTLLVQLNIRREDPRVPALSAPALMGTALECFIVNSMSMDFIFWFAVASISILIAQIMELRSMSSLIILFIALLLPKTLTVFRKLTRGYRPDSFFNQPQVAQPTPHMLTQPDIPIVPHPAPPARWVDPLPVIPHVIRDEAAILIHLGAATKSNISHETNNHDGTPEVDLMLDDGLHDPLYQTNSITLHGRHKKRTFTKIVKHITSRSMNHVMITFCSSTTLTGALYTGNVDPKFLVAAIGGTFITALFCMFIVFNVMPEIAIEYVIGEKKLYGQLKDALIGHIEANKDKHSDAGSGSPLLDDGDV